MTTTTIAFSDFVRLFSLESESLTAQEEMAVEAGWTLATLAVGGLRVLTRTTSPPLIYRALHFFEPRN